MPKRIAICPIVGDGTFDNEIRPVTSDYLGTSGHTASKQAIRSSPITGLPIQTRCMVHFVCDELSIILALANITLFPDYPFANAISGIGTDVLTTFVTDVTAVNLGEGFGNITVDVSDLDVSWGSIVLSILQQFDTAYTDINQFEIAAP